MAKKKLQMVWPKEGPKGRAPRGFMGGLRDIFTGKGPDMFIQQRGSREAITPGQWANWLECPLRSSDPPNFYRDSYHDYNTHVRENYGNITSRGAQRYDPYTRKYTSWGVDEDWANAGVRGNNSFQNPYPRYTANDMKRMWPRTSRGKHINPADMGKEWTHFGPKASFYLPCSTMSVTDRPLEVPTRARLFLAACPSNWRQCTYWIQHRCTHQPMVKNGSDPKT